jgi:Domain of Unknown Function (DUF1206)
MSGRDSSVGDAGRDAGNHAKEAARRAGPWVGRIARVGYTAKGVVYATIGVLAMREALGEGGSTTGPVGAMRSMGPNPMDGVLLLVLAAGLVGYAMWKLVQGITDPDDKGSGAHGLLRRGGYVGSGLIHGVLAFTAAQSIFGAEDTSEDAVALSVMAYQPPLGQILVGLVGLVVIGVGLYQLYAAYGAKFRDELRLNRMGNAKARWVTLAGCVGTTARALAIGVAGAFVVLAAYQSDPTEVRGLGEALETIQRQPLGSYMLGIVAAGLLVYGAFMLLVARYRRIEPA